MRVVGAGVGRTGTHSLKLALEQLLGRPCYHMVEVFQHPEHVPLWTDAAEGRPVDWAALFDGYEATVDWPSGSFWPELMTAYPDALIVLSVRESAEEWWKSASSTIFARIGPLPEEPDPWRTMWEVVAANRFTRDYPDADAAKRAYEAHNAAVRAGVDPNRLLEWMPGDGWAPLCHALGLAVPETPFPHVNTTDQFRGMTGLDERSTP